MYCKFLINICFIAQTFIHKEKLLENHTYSRLNENNINNSSLCFWMFLIVTGAPHTNFEVNSHFQS